MEIVKQEPPPPKQYRRGVDWAGIVAGLKSNPGEFYNVGEFSPGIASHIRRGKYRAFLPEGYDSDPSGYMQRHYEVTARTSSPGSNRVLIYIRYLP